jgi:predicted bacteriocin transport accessory protein
MNNKTKNKKKLFSIILTLVTILTITLANNKYGFASISIQQEKEDLIARNIEKFHFVYFMHNDCPACKFFSRIMKKFTARYNIKISYYDFGSHATAEHKQIANSNLLKEVKLYYLPTLVVVNSKTGQWVKISETILTFEELELALINFLQTKFEKK